MRAVGSGRSDRRQCPALRSAAIRSARELVLTVRALWNKLIRALLRYLSLNRRIYERKPSRSSTLPRKHSTNWMSWEKLSGGPPPFVTLHSAPKPARPATTLAHHSCADESRPAGLSNVLLRLHLRPQLVDELRRLPQVLDQLAAVEDLLG